MSQGEKSQLYQELKAAGATFDKHYREYSTDELRVAVIHLRSQPGYEPPAPSELPSQYSPEPEPVAQADTLAAQRAYQKNYEDVPIRTDENGLVWYRDEVRKPAVPAPRARRKLTYVDPGVETKTVGDGRFTETFEVAGREERTGEIRITMPSYQVGLYRDPRFPFRIHIYNDTRGFDLFDVREYYGGADLVPNDIKKVYVGNDLCYDIRTTIRAIETAYRELQLKGLA